MGKAGTDQGSSDDVSLNRDILFRTFNILSIRQLAAHCLPVCKEWQEMVYEMTSGALILDIKNDLYLHDLDKEVIIWLQRHACQALRYEII